MPSRPIFLTNYALSRLLKEFAMRLGMEEGMADVVAQVHAQQSEIASSWSSFLYNNCGECSLSPTSCAFLNPPTRSGGPSPEDVMSAYANVIESGKLVTCPVRESSEE